MLFEAPNFHRHSIINNTVALDKAKRIFDGPIVLSMAESNGISHYMSPAAQGGLPESKAHRAFHVERVRRQELRRRDRTHRQEEDRAGHVVHDLGEQTTHQEKKESYERT